ncbi:hypothetical protein N9165_03765 [Akkermansiaceae bacterium]|nr:hypothetical protein [Akkermansiaceae bacterium]
MRLLPLIIFLTSSLLGLAEEDFPVLSLQRETWEEARNAAQAKIDKSYLNRLEDLKKDSVRKDDLDAARAFDKEIKGEAKGAEEEPASLTKMRADRAKALETAFKPIDKKYWENLKLLKEYSQQQGDLEKMEVVIAEINKVLAPYEKEENTTQPTLLNDSNKEIPLMRVDGDGLGYTHTGPTKFTFPMKKNGSYRYQCKVWHPSSESQLSNSDGNPYPQKDGGTWSAEEYEIYKRIFKSYEFECGEKDKDGWYEFTCDFTYPMDDHKATFAVAFYKHKVIFIKDFKLIDHETGENLFKDDMIHKRHWNESKKISFTSKIYPTDKNWPQLQAEGTK